MRIRKASKAEWEKIFQISFENWPRGASLEQHIKACYKHANYSKGTWYILGETPEILSVLILYDFHTMLKGIGTVMTPQSHRHKGYASALLESVIQMNDDLEPRPYLLLFSDIATSFYERLGFQTLPPRLQKRPDSPCMIRIPISKAPLRQFPGKIPAPF